MKKIGIGVLIVLAVGLLIWLNNAFFTGKFIGLPDEVIGALESDDEVKVTFLENDSWLVLSPAQSTPTTGLILYPEGVMDIQSYAWVGREMAKEGFQIIFVSRRLDRDYDVADEQPRIEAVIDTYTEITTWAIGAHSFGGEIALDFAANHPERIDGVVLWGGRIGGSAGLAGSSLPVLMAYGTADDENTDLLASVKPYLPEHTIWAPIDGGNRTKFGSFGPMAADVGGTISAEEQQGKAAAATIDFLNSLSE